MPSTTDTLSQILTFAHKYHDGCFHGADMPFRLYTPAAQEPVNCQL